MRTSRTIFVLPMLLALCACGDSGALANREAPDSATDTTRSDAQATDAQDMGTPAPLPPTGAAPHARSLEGVWARADDSNPEARLYKYVVAQRFVTLTVSNGTVTRAIQGSVRISPGGYTEEVESVLLARDRWMLERSFPFTWTMSADRWTIDGTMNTPDRSVAVHEVWQRYE